jgi:hypothetical protein
MLWILLGVVPARSVLSCVRLVGWLFVLCLPYIACSPHATSKPLDSSEASEWEASLIFPVGSEQARTRTFGHPIQRNEIQWKDVLTSLEVKPRSGFIFWAKTDPEPAFRPSEIDFLSARLAPLFKEAGQHEWIAFYLQSPHSTGATEVTSGAFFVKDAQLHLYLAHFRHLITIQERLPDIKRHPLNATGAFAYELVSNRTWSVIPSEWDFSKSPLARVAEAVETQGTESMGRSIEERLRKLKELLEQNLITEEEYQHKRAELLKEL